MATRTTRVRPRRSIPDIRAVPVLAVLALVAGGCGAGAGDGTLAAEGSTTSAATDGVTVGADGILTDFGVDDETIRVGYNVDLTDIFARIGLDTMAATEVYWEMINDAGGIAGRRVVPVILDDAYDIPAHLANQRILAGDGPQSVVMIGQSTGSPHTAATLESLADNTMAAIPLSWYSGWADPSYGANVFETQANYCLESMNGISWLGATVGAKVAILSFPGEYGQDGARGAKYAAEQLGLEVVLDGESAVPPGADHTELLNRLAESGAEVIWVTVNPATLRELIVGAADRGMTATWSGNFPSYSSTLLDSDAALLLDEHYVHSSYTAAWDTGDSPGMARLVSEMRSRRPDAPLSDVYSLGWVYADITRQILEQAAADGDLTRAGVLGTARAITARLDGVAPDQSWAGDPDDYLVRATYLYDIDRSRHTPGATVTDEDAGLGYRLLEGPFTSDVARDFHYEGACFSAE